jgi:hypothetical protein
MKYFSNYWDDQINENEMDGVCSTHILFRLANLRERNQLGDINVDGSEAKGNTV